MIELKQIYKGIKVYGDDSTIKENDYLKRIEMIDEIQQDKINIDPEFGNYLDQCVSDIVDSISKEFEAGWVVAPDMSQAPVMWDDIIQNTYTCAQMSGVVDVQLDASHPAFEEYISNVYSYQFNKEISKNIDNLQETQNGFKNKLATAKEKAEDHNKDLDSKENKSNDLDR